MLPHHEYELLTRIEKLFNVGEATIEAWEMVLWYGPKNAQDNMYIDVQRRFKIAFSAFYGGSDGAHIQVLRQDGKILFLNSELLVGLDNLIE